MRRLPVLLLIALVAVPATLAQPPGPVLTDPAGDVVLLVNESEEVPGPGNDPADLRWLAIEETPETLRFHIQVEGLGMDTADQTWDAARLDVRFLHGEMRMDVATGIYRDQSAFAELRSGLVGTPERLITDLPFESDGEGNFIVEVDRDLLRDHNGVPPQRGQVFTDLHMDAHVHATGYFLQNPDGTLYQPAGFRDRMPDQGSIEYTVQTGGPVWTGPVALEVPVSFRASNGGEAFVAFDAVFNSSDDQPHTLRLEAKDVPTGWTVEHPATVNAGPGPKPFQVVVQTAFGHDHGETESFRLTYTSPDDPAIQGEAEMGIHYIDPPQPSGHHDTLFLHSASPTSPTASLGAYLNPQETLWMSTDPEDVDDDAVAIEGSHATDSDVWQWNVCLRPDLRLGLDFNNNTGLARFAFETDLPLEGEVVGSLVHLGDGPEMVGCDPPQWGSREATVVAGFQAPFAPGVETEVSRVEDTDYIPYEHGATLVLRLTVTADAPRPDPVRLLPGGSLQLPLDEYLDERPAGLTGDTENVVVATEDGPAPIVAADKDTPFPAPMAALAVLTMGLLRRR